MRGVQVGVADAGGQEFDQNLAGARLGQFEFLYLERLPELGDDGGGESGIGHGGPPLLISGVNLTLQAWPVRRGDAGESGE